MEIESFWGQTELSVPGKANKLIHLSSILPDLSKLKILAIQVLKLLLMKESV